MAGELGAGGRLERTEAQDLAEDLQRVRGMASVRVEAAVTVHAGNICDRDRAIAEGATREVQRLGMSCVFGTPIAVGSLFHLSFDEAVLDLPPQIAICDRCVMWSEEVFEVHFQFVNEIPLPSAGEGAREATAGR